MRNPVKILAGLWLLFLPSLHAAEFPPVREILLPNGMKFLLVRRGKAPIFTATIRFKVGGMDEEPGKTGLAHFMEHMAFKGTTQLDGTTMIRKVEEEGGVDYNASTSKDLTTYHVSFPSDRLSWWAALESERIFSPVFREFDQEKSVVLEERRLRIENDPDGKLFEALLGSVFQGTPYGWPTIGTAEDLKKLSEQDLKNFWRKHYHPENAVGALVGQFDLREAEQILKKTFGKIPRGKPAAPVSFAKGPLGRELRVAIKEKARPRLLVGYLKPEVPRWEDYVFDLITVILGDGKTSRLYRSLVQEKKLATAVDTHNGIPGGRSPNLFLVTIHPKEGKTEETLRATREVIAQFSKEGPTALEVQGAINRILADLLWEMKTNEGLASQLSYFEQIAGGWRYLADYPEKISAITAEDIRKVAQDYLRPEQQAIGSLEP